LKSSSSQHVTPAPWTTVLISSPMAAVEHGGRGHGADQLWSGGGLTFLFSLGIEKIEF
jgi:hypothetical protein